jgi:UPF0755 protein
LKLPYKGYTEGKKAVTIEPGRSLTYITNHMHGQGIVRHPWLLRGIFYAYRTQGKSKAGEYVFDRPMTPFEVYEKLMKGEMSYNVLTVVEGANIFDVRRVFVDKKLGTSAEVESARDRDDQRGDNA